MLKGLVLKGSSGRLIEDKVIKLGGVPGREFIFEGTDKEVVRCRVYLAGTQVINLQVWARDKEAVSSQDAIKFLDSLTLGK